ncbi:FAR1-related sequence 3 [Actinidia rufa]|uniref:FAR1-related sequence 3 n=1 Tax=Actinidia rufa TaxID=165716 RepID=A0A7J0F327_9ERIC|nr:FAR1-related sequence 3 [Actinidia rufa]
MFKDFDAHALHLGKGDADAMLEYFMRMQDDNSDFYYVMDLNENNRLRNVFWADARSRAAFKEFGDVVTFDTTYLVNKHYMPFAPFVGVNPWTVHFVRVCTHLTRKYRDIYMAILGIPRRSDYRSDYRVLRNMKANKKKVETKKSKETENALDQNMKANKMITKACKGNPHPSTSWMSSQLSCTELLKGMVSVGNSRLDKSGGS